MSFQRSIITKFKHQKIPNWWFLHTNPTILWLRKIIKHLKTATHLRDMTTGLDGFIMRNRGEELLRYQLNWCGRFVLERKDSSSIHVQCLSQPLLISFLRRRTDRRIFLTFHPLSNHIMRIIKIHSRSIRNKPIQLQSHKELTISSSVSKQREFFDWEK